MNISKWIATHPKTIIGVWILLLILITPSAIMLDQVLTYEETAFVPEGTEYTKVDELLKEKFGGTSAFKLTGGTTALLLTNIDANSPDAWRAYEEFKKNISSELVTQIDSYYDQIDLVNNIAENISNSLAEALVNSTLMLINMSDMISKHYDSLIKNTTLMYNTSRMLYEAVNQSSYEYWSLINTLNKTKIMINDLRDAILYIDLNAKTTYENLTILYDALHNMSTAVNETAVLVNMTRYAHDAIFYDVLRTYYYLVHNTTAYQRGYLTEDDINTVITMTSYSPIGPVELEMVDIVFNLTYQLVDGNTWPINDLILYEIAKNISLNTVLSMAPDDPLITNTLITIQKGYSESYKEKLVSIENNQNNTLLEILNSYPTPYAAQGILLLQIIDVGDDAINGIVDELASVYQSMFEKIGYSLPQELYAYIADKTIELLPKYTIDDLLNTTLDILSQIQPIPLNIPYSIIREIYYYGVSPDIIWILIESLAPQYVEQYTNFTDEINISTIIQYISSIDQYCNGILLYNESLLEDVVINIAVHTFESATIETPLPIDLREFIEILYNASYNEIPSIAKETMKNIMIDYMRNNTDITFPQSKMENIVNMIIDMVSENPDIDPLDIVIKIYIDIFNLTDPFIPDIIRLSINESINNVIENLINPMFRNNTLSYIESYLGDNTVPEEFVEIINDIIDYIIVSYPNYAGLHAYVSNLTKDTFNKQFIEEAGVFANVIEINEIVDYIVEHSNETYEVIYDYVEYSVESPIKNELLKIMKPALSVLKSNDNTTILIQLNITGDTDEEVYEKGIEIRNRALEIYRRYFPNAEAYISGGSVSRYELKNAGKSDVDQVQRTSVILTLIVLFIVLESLLAVIFPFLGIGVAIWVASGIVYLIATNVTDVSSWARVLMLTTSLGLGIDYTTYYIHMYKELRRQGLDIIDAAAEALRRARDGIVASASTDIIGFAALLIAWDFPFIRTIGITVPIAIAMVFIASLTLIPAIVVLASKTKLFWWPRGLDGGYVVKRSRVVGWIARNKWFIATLFAILLVPATMAYIGFRGSHDISIYLPEGSETEAVYALLKDKIGASTLSPILIVVKLDEQVDEDSLSIIEDMCKRFEGIDHVSIIYSPTRPYGEALENLTMENVEAYNGTLYIGEDKQYVLIQLLLDVPGESDEALAVVRKTRNIIREYIDKGIIEEGYVGGMPAAFVDLDNLLNEYFWHRIIPLSIILMFIALALSLRGLLAAFITMATIYLGITGSIWISSQLFTRFYGKPMLWFLPLIILVVMLGVGVDYNSFYIVRVRDEFEDRKDLKEALSIAAGSSGKLIIGLAIILSSSYAGLLFTRMWAMKEMGFVLLTGVLLTALSAVYFLTPALIAIFGHRTWYPFKRRKKEK